MFTQNGKSLVAKKLSGITDSCLDYLSIGIGARPSPTVSTTGKYQAAHLSDMRHEVLRVPIVSAMPTDSGTIKCVAELPASFSCEFTEVGLWTHRENAGSNRPQSQQVYSFKELEQWKDGTTGIELEVSTSSSTDVDYAIHNALANAGTHATYSNTSDTLWTARLNRRARKEGFRLGAQGIIARGDMSSIAGTLPADWVTAGNYIKVAGNGLSFDAASALDELSLTYFVSTNDQTSTTAPQAIRLSFQFITNDGKKATWNIERKNQTAVTGTVVDGTTVTYTNGSSSIVRKGDYFTGTGFAYPTEIEPISATSAHTGYLATATGSWAINAFDLSLTSAGNAYYCDYTALAEAPSARMSMVTEDGFKWANVTETRIYVSVLVGGSASTAYWIGLDSLRFVNTDRLNSSYGMVTYDIAYNYETRGVQTRENSPTNVMFEVSVV